MRFLVDECAGPSLSRWLQEQGHAYFRYSIKREASAMMKFCVSLWKTSAF